jgi:hypothetical protein
MPAPIGAGSTSTNRSTIVEQTEQIGVTRSALADMEQRAVRVNGILLRMRRAIDAGDLEALSNLHAAAQEQNWSNRRALLAAGAPDSILAAAGLTAYGPPDDGDPPSADELSLSELAQLPMDAPE